MNYTIELQKLECTAVPVHVVCVVLVDVVRTGELQCSFRSCCGSCSLCSSCKYFHSTFDKDKTVPLVSVPPSLVVRLAGNWSGAVLRDVEPVLLSLSNLSIPQLKYFFFENPVR